jgi:hypothetical protein
MKVLIAYDGSDCANGAIQDLRRAGLPANTLAYVLSVAELFVDLGQLPAADEAGSSPTASAIVNQARKVAREAVAEARDTAAAAADRVVSLFTAWHVESGAVTGSRTKPLSPNRRTGRLTSSSWDHMAGQPWADS